MKKKKYYMRLCNQKQPPHLDDDNPIAEYLIVNANNRVEKLYTLYINRTYKEFTPEDSIFESYNLSIVEYIASWKAKYSKNSPYGKTKRISYDEFITTIIMEKL